MKKFLAILFSIFTVLTGLVMIFIFSISYFVSEKTTGKLVETIPIEETLDEVRQTNAMKALYEQAEINGINQKTVDDILEKEEIKDYANQILQEVLKAKLEGKEVLNRQEIESKTKEFVEDINKNYNLNLNEKKVKEFTKITTDTVTNETNKIVSTSSEGESEFVALVQFCKSKDVRVGIIGVLLLELLIIVLLTWRKKSFFSYFFLISLVLAIDITIITLFIHFVLNSEKELITFAKPILNDAYILSLILFISSIFFLILHKLVKRKIELKEEVPF